MLEEVKKKVEEIFGNDLSGHGMDHTLRVYDLAVQFAKKENANEMIVALAALLHDVDDYKIVGKDQSEKFFNARKIMNEVNITSDKQDIVIDIIKNIGFSKSLKGIRPQTLEGMIVSDADMCDAIGANGAIRSVVYAVSDKGTGVVFDRNIFPLVEMDAEIYNKNGLNYGDTDNAINYFFDKLLKLKSLMLTKSGREEASIRHDFMITFLKEFFREENASDWIDFLNQYLEKIR